MRCLVVGESGQDGILVSAQLLAEGHDVVSLSRRPPQLTGVEHQIADVTDHGALRSIVASVSPDEVYYLAAFHKSSEVARPPLHVEVKGSLDVNALGFHAVLSALAEINPAARTVYASSSRIFGLGDDAIFNESSPRRPVCAYGVSKVAGMGIADLYRRERGMFVSSAILFNHESELRPPSFLSKKLALAAIAARSDRSVRISVDNLDAVADWGSARDYTAALRGILRLNMCQDYVVATGELHTVRQFAECCFAAMGLDWADHVQTATIPANYPAWRLRGDASLLAATTGWRPTMTFPEMVKDLVFRTAELAT